MVMTNERRARSRSSCQVGTDATEGWRSGHQYVSCAATQASRALAAIVRKTRPRSAAQPTLSGGWLVPSGLTTQLAPSTHAQGVFFLSFFPTLSTRQSSGGRPEASTALPKGVGWKVRDASSLGQSWVGGAR